MNIPKLIRVIFKIFLFVIIVAVIGILIYKYWWIPKLKDTFNNVKKINSVKYEYVEFSGKEVMMKRTVWRKGQGDEMKIRIDDDYLGDGQKEFSLIYDFKEKVSYSYSFKNNKAKKSVITSSSSESYAEGTENDLLDEADWIITRHPIFLGQQNLDGKKCLVVFCFDDFLKVKEWVWEDYGIRIQGEELFEKNDNGWRRENLEINIDIPDDIFELPAGAEIDNSQNVLKLEILGKNEVELAEEIEYLVKYKNNGDFRLKEPTLIFEYPSNSVIDGEKFLRKEIKLDDIYPGEEKTLSFKARIFGEEEEAKIAKAQISYHPKDIKSTYTSETTFTTLIKTVPIAFEFDLPSKIESGKEISFRLNYFSNVNYPLSDLGIKVIYPAGFEFLESAPKTLEENEWHIGLLNRAQGGRIEISGVLKGDAAESKIFSADIGIWRDGEFVVLKRTSRGIIIEKSSSI
jgi:hypothetical protein